MIVALVLWALLLAVPAVSALMRRELRRAPALCRFINRLLLDVFEKRGNKVYGFTLFCGVQGGGKTYSAVEYIDNLVRKEIDRGILLKEDISGMTPRRRS